MHQSRYAKQTYCCYEVSGNHEIKQETGNSWYTSKVDGIKDPNGLKNIPIIICFFNEHSLKVAERHLVLPSTDSSDAKSITDVILAELNKAGLTSSKVLGDVYDGASVMAGYCGGVQRLWQEQKKQKDFLCALPKPSIAPCSGTRNVG